MRSGSIVAVTDEFDAWLDQVASRDTNDPGTRPAGADEWLRATFDRHGPLSAQALRREASKLATQLAREAVERFLRDLHSTTDEGPLIEIRQDDEYGLVVSYDGGYTAPPFFAMRQAEATRELADYLQTEVHGDMSRAWPTCPEHGVGLHAATSGDQAVWLCRTGAHSVAVIGELPCA